MTTPAVLYDHMPLDENDSPRNEIVDKEIIDVQEVSLQGNIYRPPPRNPSFISATTGTEERYCDSKTHAFDDDDDDGSIQIIHEVYETVFEDPSSDFVMVPQVVDVSTTSDDDDATEWQQSPDGNQTHPTRLSSTTSILTTWITNRVKSTTKTLKRMGLSVVRKAHSKIHSKLVQSAAYQTVRNYDSTNLMQWGISDTVIISQGDRARLVLPGPLIVLGDPLCVSVEQYDMDSDPNTSCTVMVSAHDFIAATPSLSSPENVTDDDPLQSLTTTNMPSSSLSRSSSVSKVLVKMMASKGATIVESARDQTTTVLVTGGTVLRVAGRQVLNWERNYDVFNRTSSILYDGYEWFLIRTLGRRFQEDRQLQEKEPPAIELTS